MFKYVIFDIDGPLVHNEKALLCSLQKVLREEGKIYELDELRFALGIPGGQTLKKTWNYRYRASGRKVVTYRCGIFKRNFYI